MSRLTFSAIDLISITSFYDPFSQRVVLYRHEYWDRNCDFKMQMGASHRLIKTIDGYHIVEVIALPPCNLPGIHVPMFDWRVRWEPIRFFLTLSLFVFAYYTVLVSCGSEAAKAHLWRILT